MKTASSPVAPAGIALLNRRYPQQGNQQSPFLSLHISDFRQMSADFKPEFLIQMSGPLVVIEVHADQRRDSQSRAGVDHLLQ